MLSCEQVTDKLSAQIDGELTLRDRVALRFHQFICSDCKVAATNMRALVVSLRQRPPVVSAEEDQVTGDYVDRIMQALESDGVTAQSKRDSAGPTAD